MLLLLSSLQPQLCSFTATFTCFDSCKQDLCIVYKEAVLCAADCYFFDLIIVGDVHQADAACTREELDEFAAKSQQKAVAAQESGAFDAEIVPVMVKKKKEMVEFKKDEGPRPGTTVETLSRLRTINPNGFVTAGNASGQPLMRCSRSLFRIQ